MRELSRNSSLRLDLAVTNPYGDIELDARGMRALAHPVRLAILNRLRQEGPQTATGLSRYVGATPSVTSWHLRDVAPSTGLSGTQRPSETAGSAGETASRGFRVVVEDEVGYRAARALREVIDASEGDQVGDWRREVEPHLELEWIALSGLADTTVLVTHEELAQVETAIEELLSPYVLRKDAPTKNYPMAASSASGQRSLSRPSAEASRSCGWYARPSSAPRQ